MTPRTPNREFPFVARRLTLACAMVASLLLAACRSAPADPVKLVLRVQEATLVILIENRSTETLQVAPGVLDRTRPRQIELAVMTGRGTAVAPCRDVADTEAPTVAIAPGTSGTVQVDAQSVADAFCLEDARAYRLQATLAGGLPANVAPVTSNTIQIVLNAPGP